MTGAPSPEEPPDRSTDGDGERRVDLAVPDMDCPSCVTKVTGSVDGLDGVDDSDANVATGTLSVTYDPTLTDPDDIVDRVEKAGYAVESAEQAEVELSVPDMDCPSCAGKVENAIDGVEGVVTRETQPTTGTVSVTYDPSLVNDDDLVSAVERAGYAVDDVAGTDDGDAGPSAMDVWTGSRAKKTWVSGVFAAVGLVYHFVLATDPTLVTVLGRGFTVSDVAFLLAIGFGGQVILRNGYYSLRNLSLDIDLLMSAAIVGAVVASLVFGVRLYFEAATLAFLFSIAELLERYSIDRARDSLRELMALSPDEATVRRDGEPVRVPVSELRPGEVVLVNPGEKIPADGVVVHGESAVDQSPITGESVPVDKQSGDEVYAGTINEAGYLEVEVSAAADDSTLSRIIDLVEDAQRNKTEREQFVERFSGYYTPVVVTAALVAMTVPPLVFGAAWRTWFLHGIALLVIACPCAFVISTPVTVVSGITSAARHGVLIKGGNHLEAMGEVEAVALDKTGTLTTGDLAVTDVIPLNGTSEEDVLRCARGLETRSEHPVGDAIVAHAAAAEVPAGSVDAFESVTGKGVTGELHGETHYAGKPGLFDELDFDLGHVHVSAEDTLAEAKSMCQREDCLDLIEDTIPHLQSEGKTVVLVGTDDGLEGIIAVADTVREDARATVQRLQDLGVGHVVMLTGDNEGVARAVADQVGVDEFRADLLPDEKVAAVEELVGEYGSVAMVGDGINDAPALATATVGIAMGAAGTDTAIETADIALMGDDISRLPYLYDLSRRANGVIRQNIWASLGIKALLAVGIPLGYVSVAVAVLAGDAGMTTAVTGNAMRLSRVVPGNPVEREE